MRLSPWVTDERIDDVVMAIHLETGAYYVLEGTAADCWTCMASGADVGEVVDVLAARYEVDPDTAREDATAFVTSLVDEGLLTSSHDGAADVDGDLSSLADGSGRPYTAPALHRYDDLDDLLAIDPIHEVDDAGWPIARPE
jgi:hypothetical protein